MPNYTRNQLIVKGDPSHLTYFYEKNRVKEEDSMIRNIPSKSLSFEMCVPNEIYAPMISYIEKNYEHKHGTLLHMLSKRDSNAASWDLSCAIWGTKWDAIEPSVDLTELNTGQLCRDPSDPQSCSASRHISYAFDTAWNYPYNWLYTISRIFSQLEFEITYTNEEDNYDIYYVESFKKGIKTELRKYSEIERSIEEYGKDKLIQDMITYLDSENIMICVDYKTEEKMTWRDYCKKRLREDQSAMYHIFYVISNELYIFFQERELHSSIHENRELCELFIRSIDL